MKIYIIETSIIQIYPSQTAMDDGGILAASTCDVILNMQAILMMTGNDGTNWILS